MQNMYIDFDGVVLDTIETTYEMLAKVNIDKNNEEEVRHFYSNLDWEHVINSSSEINNSISAIQKIIDSKLYNISILTHVNSLPEAVAKVKFIRNHFKDITIIPVPKALSKTNMVNSAGAVLIDDFSGNLSEWERAGGFSVRFSKTLESKGFEVIDRLDKILEINL